MILKFQISDPVWWGYNLDVELENFFNLQDIIDYVIDNLNATLRSLNLLPQAEFLEKVRKDFHIHNYNFENILTLEKDEIVYICRHPKNLDNESIKIN